MLNEVKSRYSSGKTKLLIFLFLIVSQRYIFDLQLFAQFTQQGPKLVGTGGIGQPYQGSSVGISSDGNTTIIGGDYDNNSTGAVWVFTRSGSVWSQQGPKLVGTGGDGNSSQGRSVAISSDGNTAIDGGWQDNSGTGSVWIFTRSGVVWTQQGPKLAGTGAVGNSNQGYSVAISSDGNTAIVGGYEDNNGIGAVWIFIRSSGIWTQQGPKLVGTGGIGQSEQGSSVAISSDGNTAIEGGFEDNNGAGAVWIFTRSGGVWTQQGPKVFGTGQLEVLFVKVFQLQFLQMVILLSKAVLGIITIPEQSGYSHEALVFGRRKVQSWLEQVRLEQLCKVTQLQFL
jgi:hypothetical protein